MSHHIETEGAQVVVVVGPNGAGKTTLLEAIAGLAELQQGRIELNGVEISALPPQNRKIGYVSQEPYLFPNISVEGNVLYGATDASFAKNLMSDLGILNLSDRKSPATLSGGQQQRVSIARALATKPKLLLFDEPFSHLDRLVQEEMRALVKQLVHRDQVSAIYVTHSVEEAYSVADRLLFIDNGKLVETVFTSPSAGAGAAGGNSRPRTKKFAELLGYRNFISGAIVKSHAGIVDLKVGGIILEGMIGEDPAQQPLSPSSSLSSTATLAIRPEDIAIFTQKPSFASSPRNVIPVKVSRLVSKGGLTEVHAEDDGSKISIVAMITTSSLKDLGINKDDRVFAVFKATAAHIVTTD